MDWSISPVRALGPQAWLLRASKHAPPGIAMFNSNAILLRHLPPKAPKSEPVLLGPRQAKAPAELPQLQGDPWSSWKGLKPMDQIQRGQEAPALYLHLRTSQRHQQKNRRWRSHPPLRGSGQPLAHPGWVRGGSGQRGHGISVQPIQNARRLERTLCVRETSARKMPWIGRWQTNVGGTSYRADGMDFSSGNGASSNQALSFQGGQTSSRSWNPKVESDPKGRQTAPLPRLRGPIKVGFKDDGPGDPRGAIWGAQEIQGGLRQARIADECFEDFGDCPPRIFARRWIEIHWRSIHLAAGKDEDEHRHGSLPVGRSGMEAARSGRGARTLGLRGAHFWPSFRMCFWTTESPVVKEKHPVRRWRTSSWAW